MNTAAGLDERDPIPGDVGRQDGTDVATGAVLGIEDGITLTVLDGDSDDDDEDGDMDGDCNGNNDGTKDSDGDSDGDSTAPSRSPSTAPFRRGAGEVSETVGSGGALRRVTQLTYPARLQNGPVSSRRSRISWF